MSHYDADYVRQFYDTYGMREWERFERDLESQVNFLIHRHYLEQFIRPGDHVLDAGAGPGRFTIELARLGARVTVGDISPAQLELNREQVAAAGYEDRVVRRILLDITDLSAFPGGAFDAVVCYGGPLSYVFEQAPGALEHLVRVTRPGGYVLLSVMSLIGSTRKTLGAVCHLVETAGLDAVHRVATTGDLTAEVSPGHRCHMYRWSELWQLLERLPVQIVAASASNCLSVNAQEHLRALQRDPRAWAAFLSWEIGYCQEPGAIDGGTHIIAVVQRAGA